jgi:hypothetical protein
MQNRRSPELLRGGLENHADGRQDCGFVIDDENSHRLASPCVRSCRLLSVPLAADQEERNPIFAWVPSQKGLLALPPQRHRFADSTRATTRPVPLTTSRLPRTRSGPLVCGSILKAPSRTGGMSVAPLGGSPLALKPI